jgi:hypothetical protein
MKTLLGVSMLAFLIMTLSACEHHVYMETTVHENGSLDKIIVLETADTTQNFLGIGPENGWKLTTDLIKDTTHEKQDESKKWKAKFEKTFVSAQEATDELAPPGDTLFRVSSKFEKNFKWFYTYLHYSETYHTINRLDYPMDDYFTQEDFAFIDRLPAEGQVISKADSLYLSRLHDKIFDIYGLRAIFESQYMINEKLIRESGLEERWLDSLKKHKESLYQYLAKRKDAPDNFIYKAIDSLGIPLPFDKMENRYNELYREADAITSFINHASEGKYTHVINMPWSVVRTNADSVAGNRLQWNPPSIKFLLKDYIMYAEGRKLNLWTIVVSVAVFVLTMYLFWKRKIS